MINENHIILCCEKLFEECYHANEFVEGIEKILMALKRQTDPYNSLMLLKSQSYKLHSDLCKGIVKSEDGDIKLNQIHLGILQVIGQIKLSKIIVPFEFDEVKGVVFHIYSNSNFFLYKYSGKLVDYKPYGFGKAFYENGDCFEGFFKEGLRNGFGRLFGKRGNVKSEGYWKNDKFYEKNTIEYYSNTSVAASALKTRESKVSQEMDAEMLNIPGLEGKGLIAFPVIGNSMEPNYFEGEIVVCKEFKEGLKSLTNNKAYVVLHNDNLMLKKIQKEEANVIERLRLVSTNDTEHKPFEIHVNHDTRIFEIVRCIKNELSSL